MIQAKVIADSKSPFGNRLTTMMVTFPRFILAELNTHRMFSRNSASSRAIPFEKMVKSVEENPFIPIAWQKDHKGMQGSEYLSIEYNHSGEHAIYAWLEARNQAVRLAKNMNGLGVTKQLCNRLLEPFMWCTVLISGTEWENFFALRCPRYKADWNDDDKTSYRSIRDFSKVYHDFKSPYIIEQLKLNKGQAEIHMMALAEAMWDAKNESTPKQLKAGEWHIPFYSNMNETELFKVSNKITQKEKPEVYPHSTLSKELTAVRVSVAMAARTSYTVVGEEGKEPNYANDIKLHDRLAQSGHWSPFEHCAKVMDESEYVNCIGTNYNPTTDIVKTIHGLSGNFQGFVQYRKMFNNENITL